LIGSAAVSLAFHHLQRLLRKITPWLGCPRTSSASAWPRRSGDTLKSRKQAIAIGLSQARKAGAKVLDDPVASKMTAAKKAAAKKVP